jgi:hypothetical protein
MEGGGLGGQLSKSSISINAGRSSGREDART